MGEIFVPSVGPPLPQNLGLLNVGTYEGTQVVPPPPIETQLIIIGFRPQVVQIVAQLTAGPDTGLQIAKTKDMAGFSALLLSALTGFGLDPDIVQIEDNGFSVRNFANGAGLVTPYFFFAQG